VRAKIRRLNQFKDISQVQPGGSSVVLVAAGVALVAVVALAAAA